MLLYLKLPCLQYKAVINSQPVTSSHRIKLKKARLRIKHIFIQPCLALCHKGPYVVTAPCQLHNYSPCLEAETDRSSMGESVTSVSRLIYSHPVSISTRLGLYTRLFGSSHLHHFALHSWLNDSCPVVCFNKFICIRSVWSIFLTVVTSQVGKKRVKVTSQNMFVTNRISPS